MTTPSTPRRFEFATLLTAVAVGLALVSPLHAFADDDDDPRHVRAEGEERERLLKERFPGMGRIELLKIVRWGERTPGPCLSDFAVGAPESKVSMRFTTPEGASKMSDKPLSALSALGWQPAYRTPIGVGLERFADFTSVELDATETLVCQCMGGKRERETHPIRLRMQWRTGELPQVSAELPGAEGKSRILRPALTVGRLVTYSYTFDRPFPGKQAGTCTGRLELTMLLDRPLY